MLWSWQSGCFPLSFVPQPDGGRREQESCSFLLISSGIVSQDLSLFPQRLLECYRLYTVLLHVMGTDSLKIPPGCYLMPYLTACKRQGLLAPLVHVSCMTPCSQREQALSRAWGIAVPLKSLAFMSVGTAAMVSNAVRVLLTATRVVDNLSSALLVMVKIMDIYDNAPLPFQIMNCWALGYNDWFWMLAKDWDAFFPMYILYVPLLKCTN